MAPSWPETLGEVPDAILAQIATDCQVSATQVQDVYCCTPLQRSMIVEERSEVFHFVLSFGPTADIDRFCEALACVVAQNTILRTRIVEANPHGLVQVVVDEAHITERREKGQVEAYVSESQSDHKNMSLGARLFRSAFVGRVFVATIHHAVMDYWSMTTLMNVDVASAYYGQVVATRPPFKDFVTYCTRVNDNSARSFWAARFTGISSVFPDVARDQVVVASAKPARKIVLGSEGWDIPSSHMPYYIEAAWALTAAAYSYSDSTAYGLVLSGRSSALNGLEYTLGPTIVEVPIQTNIQRNRSIDRLIKDRATSLRQLQSGSAIWYDTSKIAAMNEAAKAASGFKTLLNMRPNMPVIVEDEDVRFERMVWLRGSFPLQLVCSILEDGVMVEPRCDASVLPDSQLHRVLEQFEYVLRKLVFSPAQTKLDDLDSLNPSDSLELSDWSKRTLMTFEVAAALNSQMQPQPCNVSTEENIQTDLVLPNNSTNATSTTIPQPFALWLTNPRNTNELVPIGAVGEVVMETPASSRYSSSDESKAWIQPHWASNREGKKTRFFRTGDLARFSPDGVVQFVGRIQNRVKLGGLTIQLEQLEQVIRGSGRVHDCVVCTKIVMGRTVLVAVISLADSKMLGKQTMQRVADGMADLVDDQIAAVRSHVSARLSAQTVPAVWHVLQALPYTTQQKLDRAAVRQWLSTA
ncbi:hypothetical protein AB5N19_09841 [Seiridium cardinale]